MIDMMTDFELVSLMLGLNLPIYAALWYQIQESMKAKEDIKDMKADIAEFKKCRYCRGGIENGLV